MKKEKETALQKHDKKIEKKINKQKQEPMYSSIISLITHITHFHRVKRCVAMRLPNLCFPYLCIPWISLASNVLANAGPLAQRIERYHDARFQ